MKITKKGKRIQIDLTVLEYDRISTGLFEFVHMTEESTAFSQDRAICQRFLDKVGPVRSQLWQHPNKEREK